MDAEHVVRGDAAPAVPHTTIGCYLLEKLREHGSASAQVDVTTGETQTYSEILEKSVRIARRMQQLGIGPGDVVGIASENSLDFCLPVLATFYVGAVCAPFNPAYTEEELMHAMSISRPRMIFASALTLHKVNAVAGKLGCVRELVLIGRQTPTALSATVRRLSDLCSACTGSSATFCPAYVDPETSTCLILCSSGTTGLPKGVELSHRNYLQHAITTCGGAFPFKDTPENMLGMLPFYHGFGFSLLLLSIIRGDQVVVLPYFEEKLFLGAIQNYKISTLFLVPPLMVLLAKRPLVDEYDLSSVTTIVCGAAPLSKDTQEAVAKRLGVQDIRQAYGMTESSLLATSCREAGDLKMGSAGRLIPGMAGKVIDLESGTALPRHRVGEICLTGNIMKGYRDNTAATELAVDKDGWLHTGDVGFFDGDGDLFVVDRVKEIIKYKGFQVAPAELEAVLYTHPGVRDACVVGKPDPVAGEVPVAFVVLQPDATLSEQQILDFVNGRVSPQKRLRGGVRFVSEVPRNPSGKLLRRELRSRL